MGSDRNTHKKYGVAQKGKNLDLSKPLIDDGGNIEKKKQEAQRPSKERKRDPHS